MRLALYQPDIPQNVGALIRLGACLGVPIDIIEPCGFPFSAKGVKRAGLDYFDAAGIEHHASWSEFAARFATSRRLVLSTKAERAYHEFAFRANDILLLGRESQGLPAQVHDAADARLLVPMRPGLRSLNVATAAAMVLGEALRQTGTFPVPAARVIEPS